jgi:murein L,D-transpeptidase YcbB/YkuD
MNAGTQCLKDHKPLWWSALGIVLAISPALLEHHPKLGEITLSPRAVDQGPVAPRTMPAGVIQAIQAVVESQTAPAALGGHTKDEKQDQAWAAMRSFYEKRQFRPAWLTVEGPRPQAGELLAAIDPLAGEGLDPRSYPKDALGAAVQEEKNPDLNDLQAQHRLAQADLSLTYTYLSMATHLASGRLRPRALEIDWYGTTRQADLDSPLEEALRDGGSVRTALRSYAPASQDYDRLRTALAHYEDLAAHGGWPVVGTPLRKGAQGEKVALLRARLAAEGDLPVSEPASTAPQTSPANDTYDATIADGVARFQRRHGLDPTGKVDAETLAELDRPVQERIQQLRVNLERRRWLPADFGPRYIVVNIPDFRMRLVEDGRDSLEMRAIVGKPLHNRTPELSGKMTYLVLNPAWNIPNDIVAKEIKPAAAKDPGYLDRKHIVVKGTQYRQSPGPGNPLGPVKLIFPNPFDVYLHGTTADHLFNASQRAFSHGCIRLEKPLDLTNALLEGDPKWTPEAVQAALDAGDPQVVTLPHAVPVHLLYHTAWVDDDGTVQFRRDVYGHDAKVAAALAKEPLVTLGFNAAV